MKEVTVTIPAKAYLLVAMHKHSGSRINLSVHLTKAGAEKERELMHDKLPAHISDWVEIELKE